MTAAGAHFIDSDPLAEAAARLWLDLRRAEPDLRSLVVTGCRGSEGATALSNALAHAVIKLEGSRVLLIDADPATAGLTRALGVGDVVGLQQLRDANDDFAPLLVPLGQGLDLLPAGQGAGGAGASLPPDRILQDLQKRASLSHDLLIWDSRAITASVETKRLVGMVGRAILVVESDVTRIDHLTASLNEITALKATTLAVLRNRAGRRVLSIGAGRE